MMHVSSEVVQKCLVDEKIKNYVTLEVTKAYVKESKYVGEMYKELSLNIMDRVGMCGDSFTMAQVANVVQHWAKEATGWIKEILDFCRNHTDIEEFVIGKNQDRQDIIIVVDDSTTDEVLDYNDFLFEIRGNNKEIHDFMVIDSCMKSAIDAMYSNSEKKYVRG